jgi:hypothetical protein
MSFGRITFLVCLVPFVLVDRLHSQEAESKAISNLRAALQTTYPSLAERDRALKNCVAGLRSLADLQSAATMTEWELTSGDEDTAAVDCANRSAAIERFDAAVRHLLRRGDEASAKATIDMLHRMADAARVNGEPLTLVRGFAAELADVVIQGSPALRARAARTLAHIEPPVFVAVPALTELLHADEAELRRAAADSFAVWLQYVTQGTGAASLRLRPAQRSELVLTASTVLPAVHAGFNDVRPEIRRRCLEIIGLACAALTRLTDDAAFNDERISHRPLQAEYEELRPLLQALRDQGPILERFLHDNDPETRILTHKALEELGVARGRWMRRWTTDKSEADEKLLSELLHEALPGVAEALVHPDVRVRRSAVDVLEMSGTLALPELPALTHALHDPDRFVRWSAVRTLGKLGPTAAVESIGDLKKMLHDPDGDLRKAAANALERLQSAPSLPNPH